MIRSEQSVQDGWLVSELAFCIPLTCSTDFEHVKSVPIWHARYAIQMMRLVSDHVSITSLAASRKSPQKYPLVGLGCDARA